MRALLVALALLLMPGTAMAQRAQSSTVALQELGAWAQELVAVQQPAMDAYQRCAPMIREVTTLLGSTDNGRKERALALLPGMRACVADTQAAAIKTRDGLNRMRPLPKSAEVFLKVDTGAVLRQSAAAVDGMAKSLGLQVEMLDAVVAGNQPLAMEKANEARDLAGASADGQIALLETLRAAMPMETHKAMFDIRILMTRAMRMIIVADPDRDTGELSADLRKIGTEARLAAARLRANWKRESQELRTLVKQLRDPSRTAMLAALDDAFETVAMVGDDMGTLLETLSVGRLPAAERIQILDALAQSEVRILNSIRAAGEASSKVR